MKKTAFIILSLSTMALATELQYGTGTFAINGGFLGLTSEIDTDVNAYSLVERHSNLGKFFYGYDLTWYDSDTMNQGTHTYNNLSSIANGMLPDNSSLKIPSIEHSIKGLDANIRVGYDVVHQDQDNFLGLGLLVGISIPTLEESSSKNSTPVLEKSSAIDYDELMSSSKTKIKTYKIGATVNFQKSFTKQVSVYGIGSYAYQTGNIENDYAKADYNIDGSFQEYNLGLYFTPFTETYQWGWLSLSPRIYATIGYRYSKWDVDEMAINLTGQEISSSILSPLATDFSMDSSIGYFGIGYSF